MREARRLALNVLILSLLGACAGGGGGGETETPPPPPLTFPPLAPPHAPGNYPSSSSAEFNASWGPAGTNAAIAWQNGATGAGIEVSVIDTGIDPNHPEFVGRVSPDSTDIIAGRDALKGTETHGEEVASIIAGNYNGSQTVGLAFDATILAIRADNSLGTFSDTDLANAIDYARIHGARVVNLSLGSSDLTSAVLRNAIQSATNAGVILVFSAGNEGQSGATQPEYPGFLATNAAVSHGLILIAGGLNSNGAVNTSSNPPGTAADWYLTAPGWQIVVPDFGAPGGDPHFQTCSTGPSGAVCQVQGTSFAAPQLVAAVALVEQAFPGLTPAQVVDLLLTTADDTGAPGTDSVNGRGRLNIARAFQPVGPLSIPLAATVAPGVVYPSTPLGVIGPAFGDGLTRNTSAWTVVGFDHYLRTFRVDLTSNWLQSSRRMSDSAEPPVLWRTRSAPHGLTMQMAVIDDQPPDTARSPIDLADSQPQPTRIQANLGNGLELTFAAHGVSALSGESSNSIGHFSLTNADTSIALIQRIGIGVLSFVSENGEAPTGLMQTRKSREGTALRASINVPGGALDFTYGGVSEEGGMLGLAWSDMLGATPSGETQFVGVGGSLSPLRGWRLAFSAEYGQAAFKSEGWLNVVEPLRTTVFSASLQHDYAPSWLRLFGGYGRFELSVSQPLRIESGEMSYVAPEATAYGYESLTFRPRFIDVTPSGRELRFGLNYRYFAGDWFSAFTEALYVEDPNNIADAPSDFVVRFGIRLAN